jgi:hypothetical protein
LICDSFLLFFVFSWVRRTNPPTLSIAASASRSPVCLLEERILFLFAEFFLEKLLQRIMGLPFVTSDRFLQEGPPYDGIRTRLKSDARRRSAWQTALIDVLSAWPVTEKLPSLEHRIKMRINGSGPASPWTIWCRR